MPSVKTTSARAGKHRAGRSGSATENAKAVARPKRAARGETAHDVITGHLVPEERRDEFEARVAALLAHNQLLEAIERSLQTQRMTKKELAGIAGLDASSVRRMLTSKTANPTTNNAFRMCAALGIRLEATLPSGDRIEIV